MKPLTVAQVVFSLRPGGMENGVVNLANELPAEEVSTTFLCLEEAGEFASRLKPGIPVHAFGRKPGWDWAACRRLSDELQALEPDIIHTHNLGPLIYACVARLLKPSLWRVPVLHGEHGALQGESLTPRRLRQRKLLYRLCRVVHTVSEGLRSELISRGFPENKIVSILNGVDCGRFCPVEDRPGVRRRLGLPGEAFIIGAVGRYIATKRYPLLIEAFEKLAALDESVHLMILGDGGAERDSVRQQIARSPFASRIHEMGHQQDPQPFYQAMDLLAMPSSHEGLSNALLEAMASGVPVLAHNACGAGEVIHSGFDGFLASIGSASDLAEQISRLKANPALLSTVRQKARESARQRFSLGAMIRGYLEAFYTTAGVAKKV